MKSTISLWLFLVWSPCFFGQTTQTAEAPQPSVSNEPISRPFVYNFDPLMLARLLPAPAKDGTPEAAAELGEVHRAEVERTPEVAKEAQFDDTHEDLFVYADLIGAGFSPVRLPLTARLSARLRKTGGSVDNPLKAAFHRLRPYNYDLTLHPICETNKEFSYPSGHAVNGYLYAFTLSELFPERRAVFLERADLYGRHRVVCGVHYPSDIRASRQIATFLFGALLGNQEFQEALRQSREEIQSRSRALPPGAK